MSSEIKEKFNNITSYANKTFNKLIESEQNYIIITFVIIFFILFCLLTWIYSKLTISDNACKQLETLYRDPNPFKGKGIFNQNNSIDDVEKKKIFDLDFQFNNNNDFSANAVQRNYYVKTAFNCCCIDGYKNNFVNICALIECIKLGARCLDFEVYYLNNKPIIAASTANNNSIKETYNELQFSEVLTIIKEYAFNENHTGCHNDPLYLHFRIMSDNIVTYDKMGETIETILFENNPSHSQKLNMNIKNNNYNGSKFLELPFKELSSKIIIMCNAKNKNNIQQSKLSNVTNIISGGTDMGILRFQTLKAIGNNQNTLLRAQTKNKFYIVLPDLDNKMENYDYILPLQQGCQFIAMKFQNYDNYLNQYFNMFKDNKNYSFIPKSKYSSVIEASR